MNWLDKTRQLLGRFWSVVFSEKDFTLGVRNLLALMGMHQQTGHDMWTAGHFALNRTMFQDRMPFAIYLLKSEVLTVDGNTSMQDMVVHPAADWDDVLSGAATLDDRQEHGGWLVRSRFDIPVPHHMSDHVIGYTRTLFNGIDYELQGDNLLFHFDPSTLALPTVAITGDDGVLRVYWKLFGWTYPELAIKETTEAFDDASLNPYSDTVWDIHQNGATYYNVKKLLGDVTGSVVCKNDGAVDYWWTEQDIQCIMVGDCAYYAPADARRNFDRGDNVRAGDVLFGTLSMVSSVDMLANPVSSDVAPGISVMTDVGRLIAENQSKPALTVSGTNILPLVGEYGGATPAAYSAMCERHVNEAGCPVVDVPDTVNPFQFIMCRMRVGCGLLASFTVKAASFALTSALNCVRKSISASGMMTVYMQAEGDTVNTQASFTATGGNAAVAELATVNVQDMFAEADIAL